MVAQYKLDKVWESKKPKTKDNYVGIELEFISELNIDEIQELIAINDLENYCQLKGDGSIDTEGNYRFGHEICILVKEFQVSRIINKLCDMLKDSSTVNNTCGMHVHLDMRNRSKEMAYARLYAAQKLFYSMVPSSRLRSGFCFPTSSYEQFYEVDEFGDRYIGINTLAYEKYKTIEIRIHSGTLQADKIINWVKLLTKIVNGKSRINVAYTPILKTYKDVKRVFRIKGKLDNYIKERIIKFQKGHEKSNFKLEGELT